MYKTVALAKTGIQATFKKVRRSRSFRINVYQDGRVVVTAPYYETYRAMERFVWEHIDWIKKRVTESPPKKETDPGSQTHYLTHKRAATRHIKELVLVCNRHYAFPFKTITVRNQKTCWGSCSSGGTLSFNYQIAFLPEHLAEYVVAHELCHLKELNHSRAFWQLVAETVPDWKKLRRDLKKHRIGIT